MHPSIARDIPKLFDSKLGTGVECLHYQSSADTNPVTREGILKTPEANFTDPRTRFDSNTRSITLPATSLLSVGHEIEIGGTRYRVTSVNQTESTLMVTGMLRAT